MEITPPNLGWYASRNRRTACAWERSAPQNLFFKRGEDGEQGGNAVGSVGRARSFARQLVSSQLASYHRNGDINHAFPQCYWFCASEGLLRPQGWLRVGKLEAFSADVARILEDAGLEPAAAREVAEADGIAIHIMASGPSRARCTSKTAASRFL